ncbi:hypothetical protein IFM89_037210 [Coptis chinensis]|uniref:Uncharacterized protein n=1 Tax=Coptis chinensis TaxID=261450 RepID=A0A835M1T1_9MAGN|nr:hypothetical protein IFM89_037210 [Coptis chinensis]
MHKECLEHARCKKYELGVQVAEHLLTIEPDIPGHYVLLSNMYALAGRMDRVEVCFLHILNKNFVHISLDEPFFNLLGETKYRATGCAFVVLHKSYSMKDHIYASSQFVMEIERGDTISDLPDYHGEKSIAVGYICLDSYDSL